MSDTSRKEWISLGIILAVGWLILTPLTYLAARPWASFWDASLLIAELMLVVGIQGPPRFLVPTKKNLIDGQLYHVKLLAFLAAFFLINAGTYHALHMVADLGSHSLSRCEHVTEVVGASGAIVVAAAFTRFLLIRRRDRAWRDVASGKD